MKPAAQRSLIAGFHVQGYPEGGGREERQRRGPCAHPAAGPPQLATHGCRARRQLESTGYRIYLAKDGDTLIVLFGGGTKRGQQRDIDKAKELLAEYKARKKAMTSKSISKHKG